MVERARFLIETLGLVRHPERGYYAETYRAPLSIEGQGGPHGGTRAASTAIYFLLTQDDRCTHLHRLISDELFHLYEGGPLEVLLLPPEGPGRVETLGLDFEKGHRPQIVIPAGTWFATELPQDATATHCLWGCTVAPGFTFEDFELAEGPELSQRYPAFSERIARMARKD